VKEEFASSGAPRIHESQPPFEKAIQTPTPELAPKPIPNDPQIYVNRGVYVTPCNASTPYNDVK